MEDDCPSAPTRPPEPTHAPWSDRHVLRARSGIVWRPAATFGVLALALLMMAPLGTPVRLAPGSLTLASTAVPTYDHIFILMEENANRTSTGKAPYIIGNPQAPYLNSLASTYAQSSNYHGVTHPSIPNYMAATTGNVEAKISNTCHPGVGGCTTSDPAIVDRVEASGRTWKAYLESMPVNCDLKNSSDGLYKTHFNPFVYFSQIRNSTRCQRDVPFTQFSSDLAAAATTPNYVWITPNTNDNMNNKDVAKGDAWAKSALTAVFNSPAWRTQRSLLIVTWDENYSTSSNNVAFIAVASNGTTQTNFTSALQTNHYNMLRTVEASWGLAPVGTGDAAAAPMTDLFR
jgi:hypothetical protein